MYNIFVRQQAWRLSNLPLRTHLIFPPYTATLDKVVKILYNQKFMKAIVENNKSNLKGLAKPYPLWLASPFFILGGNYEK
jgi:hypothetical protein